MVWHVESALSGGGAVISAWNASAVALTGISSSRDFFADTTFRAGSFQLLSTECEFNIG